MAGCRHPDIQRFGEIRCCLSCGEAIVETAPEPEAFSYYSGSPHYRYTPLKYTLGQEIRLIVLYAGELSDDLICDIVVVNLADRPAYEAVSYTWADAEGDVSITSSILCRGKSIPITRNCDAALRRLRLQSRNRRLWVDAISINQKDTSEKNHQVRLMSKIYMKASQVLAYLGVEPQQVTNELQRIIDFLKDENSRIVDGSRLKKCVTSLFNLAYFDRVWILQEVGLSQLVTLIIGTDEVRWTGAVISKMLNLSYVLGIQAPSILRWNPASRPEEERDILAILSRGRTCSATDPRDKVYALLGLMHSDHASRLGIDYSLSTSEVFTKLAVYCIETGRFDILQHVHHNHGIDRMDPSLAPTWVPFWDSKDVFEPPPRQFSQADKDLFAVSWHMPHVHPGAWLGHALPQRIIIQQILTWVSFELQTDRNTKADSMNLSTATWRWQIREWAKQRLLHDSARAVSPEEIEYLVQHISNQQNKSFTCEVSERDSWSIDDASARDPTLPKPPVLKLRAHHIGTITKLLGIISNARDFYIPHTRWQALGSHYCELCIYANVSHFRADATNQARNDLKMNIDLYGAGKLAFETERSVGFTRATAYVGDSIWILYGADVPFILRQVRDRYHMLLGDCYLHRAGKPFPCKHCGADVEPWPMQTEIIDLW